MTSQNLNKSQLIEKIEALQSELAALKDSAGQGSGSIEEIARQQQSATSLMASENNLKETQRLGRIGHWILNPETLQVEGSDELLRIFGITREDLSLQAFVEVLHPDDSQYVQGHISQGLTAGKEWDIEHRLATQQGSEKIVHAVGKVVTDDHGKVTELWGIVQDITDRKLSEAALRDSEEKYRNLVETSQDLIWKCDAKGCFTFLNPAWEKTHGYKIDEMLGRPFTDFQTPEVAARDTEEFGRHIAGGAITGYETTQIAKSGKTLHMIFNAMSLFGAEGEIIGTQGTAYDITERKRSEKALKESEETYRLIFEAAANLITSVNSKGILVDCNKRIEEVLGYKREEIIGQHLGMIIHPDYHSTAQASVVELITTGTAQFNAFKMVRKDGKLIDVNINSSAITNQQGAFVRSFCIIDDITEHKRVEEALRESERKLIESQRIARLGYYVLDVKTGCWTSSLELDHVLGIDENYTRDVAGWLGLVHPDHKESMMDYLQDDILAQHKRFDQEYKILDATSGAEKWVHGLGNLNLDADGNPTEMFGTIQDITARKQAEKALMESEERFRKYVSSAPDGIFIADSQGRYVDVNEAACKMTGYSESELLRLSIPDLADPDRSDNTLEEYAKLKDKGRISSEMKLKHKDGSLFWVSLDAVKLSDDRFMAFCSDITETRRLQELESRAARLETAGTIAGQVAHDFNNLLAPLVAYPEFIREELPKNHPTLQYLDQIEKAATKMADINQDLLAMGRRGHYNQAVLNLNSVVQQALSALQPLPKTLPCDLKLSDKLNDIYGGVAQLHRVVANLLNNAREAMQDIGHLTIKTENFYVDQVSVAYGGVPKGEYVKLTITDTGCGIPADIANKIFDPFFTSKSTDKKRGSGLGMSVVHAVIKDHQGFIDFSTKVGEGTAFYVYLPVTEETVSGQESGASDGGHEKIHIVDDDATQREVSSRLLQKLGYEVSTSESGERAIDFLRENPRDLVMLDMVMPGGIDGAETYRQILEVCPDQRAIILSGFSGSDRVLEAQKLGAGVFVKKPVTMKSLAAAVRKELDRTTKVSAS